MDVKFLAQLVKDQMDVAIDSASDVRYPKSVSELNALHELIGAQVEIITHPDAEVEGTVSDVELTMADGRKFLITVSVTE